MLVDDSCNGSSLLVLAKRTVDGIYLVVDAVTAAVGAEDGYLGRYARSAEYKSPELALPSPALKDGTLDFSFSGLKTAAINLIHRYEQKGIELPRAAFAARYTFEAVEAVAKKLAAALDAHPGYDLIVSGGVAANSHLRARLGEISKERGRALYLPPLSLCGDNAAMIAAAGYFECMAGNFASSALNASAMDMI